MCSAVSVAGEGVWDREPPRECAGEALSEPRQGTQEQKHEMNETAHAENGYI